MIIIRKMRNRITWNANAIRAGNAMPANGNEACKWLSKSKRQRIPTKSGLIGQRIRHLPKQPKLRYCTQKPVLSP